jgi:hypothetical protein
MTLALPLAFLVPVIAGSLFLYAFWPKGRSPSTDLPLIVALGAGLGLGLSSAACFVWLVSFGPSKAYLVVEVVGLAVLLGFVLRRIRTGATAAPDEIGVPQARGGRPARAPYASWLLTPGFAFALVAAVVGFGYRSATYPHGGWDAATIWNLRARFLFRGGDHWKDAFSELLGTWTHADYPLLVPGTTARAWSFIGSEPQIVPMLVGLLFTLAAAFLLLGALASLRSRGQGLLAGIVLLCSHALVFEGANQYADVPLAFFMLATFVALALADTAQEGGAGFLALAGLTSGLAAWTKNEGLLFVLVVLVVHLLVIARLRGWKPALRREGIMLLGLAPMLLLIIAFKWGIAPGNDLLASLNLSEVLDRLTAPWRYGYVIREFVRAFLALSGWLIAAPLVLALYLLAVGWRVGDEERASMGTMLVTLGLVLAGYLFIYIVTPYDLEWHVNTSIYRLAFHSWPSLLFAYFLIARAPEAAVAHIPAAPPAEITAPARVLDDT